MCADVSGYKYIVQDIGRFVVVIHQDIPERHETCVRVYFGQIALETDQLRPETYWGDVSCSHLHGVSLFQSDV